MREGFPTYRQRNYECGCCEVIVVRIRISNHALYVFGVYLNPDLLTAIDTVKSIDRKASFCLLLM